MSEEYDKGLASIIASLTKTINILNDKITLLENQVKDLKHESVSNSSRAVFHSLSNDSNNVPVSKAETLSLQNSLENATELILEHYRRTPPKRHS